jgi:hypothetical protein
MFVDFTPEQKALRAELHEYFDRLMTPERQAVSAYEGGKVYREAIRQMGSDGWLGVGWPKEYGGQGRTAIEQMIFVDEMRRCGAPFPFVTLNTVGPALMSLGSDEQKKEFLPRILAGDAHFAIGYSEPDAGTDLASLKTSAVRDGDDYIINGTKIFTSGGNDADYVWLAARTDEDAPKHKGITIFILDTQLKGYSSSLIHTVGGGATCMTYYDNIRVPASMIVGELNGGWRLITTQLNHERIGLAAWGAIAIKHYEEVLEWARTTPAENGGPVAEKGFVQSALAEAFARVEAMKLMNWRMACDLEAGRLNPANASAVKVFGSETAIEIYRLLTEVLGSAGAVRPDSPGVQIQGEIERNVRMAQINTFGAGVNEIQREIVSMAGLRMPRVPR